MGISRARSRGALTVLALGGVLSALGTNAAGTQAAGTIAGQVTTASPSPADPLPVTTDQAVCGPTVPDESLVANAAGGVAHAIVTLSGTNAGDAADIEPRRVTNKGCRFAPHVQIVRPGSALQITSEDPTLHTTHAYAESTDSLFNVAVPVPGLTITRQLNRPERVMLRCDTHPWMRGYVLVTDEIAAVTNLEGRFRLEAVPPGAYELQVWHETLGVTSQQVTVVAGETQEITIVQ